MKYALIGCGRIATNHVKAVLNNGREFVAACDIDLSVIETLLAKHDLQNDTSIFKSMQLATVLNVTPSSDAIMIALAYGNEGEDFEYVKDSQGNKIDFAMKDGKTPRTLEDLQTSNGSLIKDIELSSIVQPDYDDRVMLYIVYGGGGGAHYRFKYDEQDPTKKVGVIMQEQRIFIVTVGGKPYVYNEYGYALPEKTAGNDEGYTITANGDGTYTYTYTDKKGSTVYNYRIKRNEIRRIRQHEQRNGKSVSNRILVI